MRGERKSVLIYEKPLQPEEVIKRAQAWEKIFEAKDKGEPVKVKIHRHVRDDIYEIFYMDTVKGLLKSPKKHDIGEETDALVVVSDYTTKTFRTRLYEKPPAVGEIVQCELKKITSKEGLIVKVGNLRGIVPKPLRGKSARYSFDELKRAKLVGRVMKVSRKGVVVKIIDVKI